MEPAIQTRSYQNEMFERSMKGNIIVAMDTGSGKTHVALLRIAAELERCPSDRFVWFLAPTVALCLQQEANIKTYLPAVMTRLLVGSDEIDKWSLESIWNAALAGVQVVVSTHAILLDALTHGFVKMSTLALLIFDEAHHCNKNHPANRIMKDFYHPLLLNNGVSAVPHILGLSASPIMRSNPKELDTIEAYMNSRAVTPRTSRQELLKFVHRPTFRDFPYVKISLTREVLSSGLPVFDRLRVLSNSKRTSEANSTVVDQIRKFSSRATVIFEELGSWAAEYFIRETYVTLEKSNLQNIFLAEWQNFRPQLFSILEKEIGPLIQERDIPDVSRVDVSHKVQQLLKYLCSKDPTSSAGLIFVQQRVTVGVLCKLLSRYPDTKDCFKIATFVGTSNNSNRRYNLDELLDLNSQQNTLSEFRAREKNIVIATDVLEEGIDISACNLVICFDPPANLKSFIQRRGRARQKQSEFLMMIDANKGSKLPMWHNLEREMVRRYQDENGMLQGLCDLEQIEEALDYRLQVDSTGAVLTAESAMSHLYHFCSTLPLTTGIENQPEFSFEETDGRIMALVRLPNSLSNDSREARSQQSWLSERAAAKDAAFQMYSRLYDLGLINDNLLPLVHDWVPQYQMESLDSILEVSAQWDVIAYLADAWRDPTLHQYNITVRRQRDEEQHEIQVKMTCPREICLPSNIQLFWDQYTTLSLSIENFTAPLQAQGDTLMQMRKITHHLHQSTHQMYVADAPKDFVLLFTPNLPTSTLAELALDYRMTGNVYSLCLSAGTTGLIRSTESLQVPFVFDQWVINKDHVAEIRCTPLPRRRNFLSPIVMTETSQTEPGSSNTEIFSAPSCTADKLPIEYAYFNLLVPSLIRYIEVYAVASRVASTILAGIPIQNLEHVATALNAPSSGWVTNYQAYEFIGDSVLKYVASIQLFLENPQWHEGYLTHKKAYLVSNPTLAKAAMDHGLDQYIMILHPRIRKWVPPLLSKMIQSTEKRQISMKVLADIVEALIGAFYLDSGVTAAKMVINRFIPEIGLGLPSISADISPLEWNELSKVESLIGYTFTHKNKHLLAEAMTHPSYISYSHTQSYQRLEFLGDAVLDMLIADMLASQDKSFSPYQMTCIKICLVNADILGYCCLNYSSQRRGLANVTRNRDGSFNTHDTIEGVPIWKFMRHSSNHITASQQNCVDRFEKLAEELRHEIESRNYPWTQLARLSPDKFLSDLIESIIGAIYLDSDGDLTNCRHFLERIGLVAYANKLIQEDISVIHPKAALQQRMAPKSVKYVIQQDDVNAFSCQVLIDGKDVVAVSGCLSKDTAIVIAAKNALQRLESDIDVNVY